MKKDVSTLVTLLNDFLNSLDNRSAYFIHFFKDTLLKILDWNFTVWKLQWQSFDKKTDDWTYWFQLSDILKNTIRVVGQRFIKQQQQYLFTVSFLDTFKKHAESHKTQNLVIENKARYYVPDLFRIFYQLLFEFEESAVYSERGYMWSSFPKEWKITKDNILDKENLFARISLHEFLDWTLQRFSARKTSDPELNDVAINLFPEVEPATWAHILIFVLSPYDSENRISSIISIPRSFGYDFARVEISSFSEGEFAKKEKLKAQKNEEGMQNAYELAILIFPNIFTKKLLDEYVKEASKLKYTELSGEEHKRLELLRIFTQMKKTLRLQNEQ